MRSPSARILPSAILAIVSTMLPGVLAAGDPAAGATTYSRDVAPIFRERCETCHRPGEAAPMPLLTYEQARPWARSIRKEVEARRMPPWHADPAHGKFLNDPTLTEKQIQIILAWIDGGAPEGDPAALPPRKDWVEGWRIGKPDAIFEMPTTFDVPATGVVKYQYFIIPTNFTEDKWISQIEARPGNRAIVHHILVFALERGQMLGRGERGRGFWDSELTGTAPGEGPTIFPPGKAKRIRAGSSLLLQVHYTPNGENLQDRSKVGLIFARDTIREEMMTKAATNNRFQIPPGAESYPVESWYTFRQELTLHSMMPHMHLRGKSFEYRLVAPDGAETVVLKVPRYDFNWQHSYVLAEPITVKAGSKLHCIAHFDNSSGNAANPDSTQAVRWGDQTWEEMMIGFIGVSRPIGEPDAETGAGARGAVEGGKASRAGQF